MMQKSLLEIDKKLLVDYDEAEVLNPHSWEISEYWNWKYDMNAALTFSKLYFPSFIEINDCIILAFRFNTSSFNAWSEQFGENIREIEAACNAYTVSDYFFQTDVYNSDELYIAALREFALALKVAWELNCRILYPNRNIVCEILGTDADIKITLYSLTI